MRQQREHFLAWAKHLLGFNDMREPEFTWTMIDGTKIKLSDMTDSHLCNCYHMCLKRDYRQLMAAYQALGMMRGEMAIMAVEDDINRMEQEGWFNTSTEVLEEEINRRGIDPDNPPPEMKIGKIIPRKTK